MIKLQVKDKILKRVLKKKGKRKMANDEEVDKLKIEFASFLIFQNFSVIKNDLQIVESLKNNLVASPRIGSYPRNPVGRVSEVFFAVNQVAIFDHIAESTTARMDTKVRNSVVTGQNAQRYYTKAVSRKEVLIVIGLQFIFRGRKNISSIEEQFQLLPPDIHKVANTRKKIHGHHEFPGL